MIGVIIEKGASDWQIFQQENGYAKVTLEGHYVRKHDPEKEEGYAKVPNVFVMVSKEENGEPVIWWRKCEISGAHWQTELDIPAGGPYTIHTSLSEGEADRWSEWNTRGDIIQHVGVGDLYVIAGQSNSSGYGKDFITDPPELGVHVYKNNGRWTLAAHPLQDSTGADGKPNLDASNTGHSLYLSFAKYLKHDLGYPIGLIQTSQGGSPLSAWNPGQDGRLYRNMIQCITVNYPIKSKKSRNKFKAFGGRPSFYFYSHFMVGSEISDWLGSEDLMCDTDEQLVYSVSKIKEAYDEFKKMAKIQREFMISYKKTGENQYTTEYADGSKVISEGI